MMQRSKAILPPLIYISFCVLILGMMLIYKPGWGFMDDFTARQLAISFWDSPDKWNAWEKIVQDDIHYGRFRPVYYAYVIVFYGLFRNTPLLFNLFLTTLGLLALLSWGRSLQLAYRDEDPRLLWIYPLSFVIFTPFWNIFMYISLQEKFHLIVGGVGLWLYYVSKKETNRVLCLLSVLLFILMILAKETGISIAAALGGYCVMDSLWLSRERKINLLFAGTLGLFAIPYLFFIKIIVLGGHYSKDYGLGGFWMLWQQVPLIIKGVFILTACSLTFFAIKRWGIKEVSTSDFGWVVFPLCLLGYLSALIPWGYPTYMLSTVSMFLFPTLYCVVPHVNAPLKSAFFATFGIMSLVVLLLHIIPSIGIMADKRSLIEFVQANLSRPDVQITSPPPLEEQSATLAQFTGANTHYFKDGVIDMSNVTNSSQIYLLTNLECGPFKIKNGRQGSPIYQNSSWSIHSVIRDHTALQTIVPEFHVPRFKRFKKMLTHL